MPTLEISVPDDTFDRLTRWAAARNLTVEEAIAPILDVIAPRVPTQDERQHAFEELTKLIQSRSNRYPQGFRVDDSRESIYEGCGE
jgi:hypothetical protein